MTGKVCVRFHFNNGITDDEGRSSNEMRMRPSDYKPLRNSMTSNSESGFLSSEISEP